MIRAVLVDDEPPARVRMRQLLDAAGDVTVVGEAGSAVEAREVIRETRPDLLFLDVEMPEVRGTALAASLPEPRPFIVFATAFDNYGLEAIAVEATDYLLKPVSRIKLAATLDRVRARLARSDTSSATSSRRRTCRRTCGRARCRAIPGFDCAAASLPARGVGGDFYDVFRSRMRRMSRCGRCCSAMRPARASRPGSSPRRCRRASTPPRASRISDPRS